MLLALAAVASAQEAYAQDVDLARARAAFERALVAYEGGDYEAAMRGFQEAHELTGNAEILYNVAQCADRLRRDDIALAAYRGYLEGVPDSEDREAVEARIAVLERDLAEEEARVEREVAERERRRQERERLEAQLAQEREAAERARRERPADPGAAPWVVLGAGGAAAAAGVVLVVIGELDAACVSEPSGCVTDPSQPRWAEVSDAYGRAEALRIAGWVSIGVGAAAIVAGLTWGIASVSVSEDTALRFGPGGVSYAGVF